MNYKRGLNLSGVALFAVFLTTALTGCAAYLANGGRG